MAWNNQPQGKAKGNYFIRERRFIGEATKASIVDAVAHAAVMYAMQNGGQGPTAEQIDKLKLAAQFAATRVEGGINWQNEKVQEAIDNDRRNPAPSANGYHSQPQAVPQPPVQEQPSDFDDWGKFNRAAPGKPF